VRDILSGRTVRGIAQNLAEAGPLPDSAPLEGPVGLTPLQQRFFAWQLADPGHFNMSVTVTADGAIDPQALEKALAAVVARHDLLRAVAHHETLTVTPQADVSRVGPISAAPTPQSFPLSEGPLFRADVTGTTLTLTAHHLVVDAVSWRILLADLADAYAAAQAGQPIHLPPVPATWSDWIDALAQVTRTLQPHWPALRDLAARARAHDPFPARPETTADPAFTTTDVTLPVTLTADLLGPAAQAYATDPGDLILAATALALSEGKDAVALEAETHGRHEIPGGPDLTRTVGWFTSCHPVVVDTTGPAQAIVTAKEGRRRPPGGPLAFGLAAHDPASGVDDVTPSAAVNYLGVLDQIAQAGFRPGPRPADPPVGPRNRPPHALAITAGVRDGRLTLSLQVDPQVLDTGATVALAARLERELAHLAAHCLAQERPTATASDYQSPTLDQTELSEITDLLGL
jgi:non-ribosomal peptide synthase protein (TIGR01720 family)